MFSSFISFAEDIKRFLNADYSDKLIKLTDLITFILTDSWTLDFFKETLYDITDDKSKYAFVMAILKCVEQHIIHSIDVPKQILHEMNYSRQTQIQAITEQKTKILEYITFIFNTLKYNGFEFNASCCYALYDDSAFTYIINYFELNPPISMLSNNSILKLGSQSYAYQYMLYKNNDLDEQYLIDILPEEIKLINDYPTHTSLYNEAELDMIAREWLNIFIIAIEKHRLDGGILNILCPKINNILDDTIMNLINIHAEIPASVIKRSMLNFDCKRNQTLRKYIKITPSEDDNSCKNIVKYKETFMLAYLREFKELPIPLFCHESIILDRSIHNSFNYECANSLKSTYLNHIDPEELQFMNVLLKELLPVLNQLSLYQFGEYIFSKDINFDSDTYEDYLFERYEGNMFIRHYKTLRHELLEKVELLRLNNEC